MTVVSRSTLGTIIGVGLALLVWGLVYFLPGGLWYMIVEMW